MNQKNRRKLIEELLRMAPAVPYESIKNSHLGQINWLLELSPDKPYKMVGGVQKLEMIPIPNTPNLKQ